MQKLIKKLSEFGEGFKHHHENYSAQTISAIRETGGVWHLKDLSFYFPEHFGFCYGVDKAIDMVFETCERSGGKRIFLTDQLIHNPYINNKLKEKGVRYLKRDGGNLLVCDELSPEDVVVVSAFGTDYRDVLNLKDKGVTIVDSTCGAIINVWKRVEGYAKNGFITIMHGKRNHEETRATVSQAVKEGGAYLIIENKSEAGELAAVIRGELSEREFIQKYPEACSEDLRLDFGGCSAENLGARLPDGQGSAFGGKMGMANQTTMLKGESLEIQEILRAAFKKRFGEAGTLGRFRSFDTICGATQDRQDALHRLLEKPLDFILIVGGFNSSNTSHLAEIAQGKLSLYHIESAGDILSAEAIRVRDAQSGEIRTEQGWFPEGAGKIGITSGASTPDVTLFEIIQKVVELRR